MKLVRGWKGWVALSVVLMLGGWAAVELTLRSDWFAEKLRTRVVAELERVSGAKAEVAAVRFDRAAGRVRIEGIALRTQDGAEPFLEIGETETAVSLDMLLGSLERLPALRLSGLVARVVIDEQGGWNWPPRIAESLEAGGEFRVESLDLQDALLLVEGRPFHVRAAAEGLEVQARDSADGACYAVTATAERFAAERAGFAETSGPLETDLSLCGSQVKVSRFDYQARDSKLSGSGEIDLKPTPTAQIRFEFDGPVERWLRPNPEGLKVSGRAVASGELRWSADDGLQYKAAASAASLNLEAPFVAVENVQLKASASGDLARARVESLAIGAAGGLLTASGGIVTPFDSPRVELEGELSSLRLKEILRIIAEARDAPSLPPSPWVSTVSGNFKVSGSAPANLESSADLRLSAPEGVAGPALEGTVALSYSGANDIFELHTLGLTGPGVRLSARGDVARDGTSLLDVALRADAPDRVETMLNLTGRSLEDFPFKLRGGVSFDGDVTGKLRLHTFASTVKGRLETGPIQLLRYDWDSLRSDVRIDSDGLHLEHANLKDGDGLAVLDVDFQRGDLDEMREWPLRGRIEGQGLVVSKAVTAADLPVPATGSLAGQATLAGSLAALEVNIDFRVRDGDLAGMRFDEVTGSALAAAGRVDVLSLKATRAAASLEGTGAYTREPRAFQFDVRGSKWNPADSGLFEERTLKPAGDLSFALKLVAALAPENATDRLFSSLQAEGSWQLADLEIGGRDAGSWTGKIATEGDLVRFDLSGSLLQGAVSGSGEVKAENLLLRANLTFDGFALETLTAAADLPLEQVTGSVAGSASIQGPLTNLEAVTGEGELRKFEAQIADIPGAARGYSLYNPFPMHWSYAGGRLRLEHMRLQGEGTDVEVDGDIGLAGEPQLNVNVDGEFNLTALNGLRPGLRTAGRSTVEVKIEGAPREPRVTGRLDFHNADIRSDVFPTGLAGLNGQVVFDGRNLRIESLEATSGGGRIVMTGGGRLSGEGAEYRFEGRVQDVRLRYPQNLSSTVDGDFTLSGSMERSLLSGEVLLKRMSTSRDTTLGMLIDAVQEPTPSLSEPSFLESMQINVHVASGPSMKIDTALIRDIAADIDLRVIGTFTDPSLLGDVNINRGEVSFHGSRYTINRGNIEFRNPVRIEPLLDFELETRIRAVDIALILSGPARKMNISYRSDPPLSFSDLVNLVAVGRAPTTDPLQASQQRVEQQSLFQTGANNVFDQAVRRPVSPGLQRFFGVSRLKVDPQVGGAEANPSARISTEQQITDDVTLIYTYDLSSAQQQTVRLEWAPNRRWTFVVTRDENGLVGSDILYRTRLP